MIPVDFLCFGVKLRERQMGLELWGKSNRKWKRNVKVDIVNNSSM